jgi:micrococcal nuclease
MSPAPAPALCAAGTDELRCADVSSMELAPVLRIVDGDTLHVQFAGRDESVRLYGVDAPEVGARCADDATARLRELAAGAVRLRPDARDRDRYKRLLRYVFTTSGESIDATLVREGLARAWRGDGELEHPIEALEADARSSGRGCLWREM